MGDKSPKSASKKASQKQAKATNDARLKRAAEDAKHIFLPKKK
jgi:hypothetical protein